MKEVKSTELRESIQVELLETKRLLEEVKDHPVMSVGLEEKVENLEAELSVLKEREAVSDFMDKVSVDKQ